MEKDKPTITEIGWRFRKRLDDLGLSYDEAIEAAGLTGKTTQTLVSRHIRARDPHLSTLEKLAKVAQTSVSYLIGESED